METQVYRIPSTGSQLRVSWQGKYESLTVALDEVPIGMPYPKVTDGVHLTTPDGHEIDIRLLKSKAGLYSRALQVSWDRQVLPGSETEDHIAVKDAQGCSGLVVILMVIFTVLALASKTADIALSLVEVAIYLVLWFFIRKGSFPALLAFTILYVLSTVYLLVTIISLADRVIWSVWIGALLRFFALSILIKGAIAMNKLNKAKTF
ncbi:MAG TPA: hypothetical protein VFF78_08515 [Anaerolineaceae bacterium]|jgi:hypothetical protein|nr:hypothetical protein [Anaerolineaceae bacterium]